jgi:phage N-6-adenine-methyltransferase
MISPALYSSRSDEWGTPAGLFLELDREFRFTLDPCATRENAKCRRFFTKADDGLCQDWAGERVFVNPPYGRHIGDWLAKAHSEASRGALVVCLVHVRTDTRWWHQHVQGKCDEIRFVKGRLKFERPGCASCSSPFPSAILIYRPRKRVDPPSMSERTKLSPLQFQ